MKRADLEKQLGKKIAGRMQQEPQTDRYGAASAGVGDKREQRERDKAAGLVPFAVKLPQALVSKLQSLAIERNVSLNDVTAELLGASLEPATSKAPAEEAPAQDTQASAAPKARKSTARSRKTAGS